MQRCKNHINLMKLTQKYGKQKDIKRMNNRVCPTAILLSSVCFPSPILLSCHPSAILISSVLGFHLKTILGTVLSWCRYD